MNIESDAADDPRRMLDLIASTRRATMRRLTRRYVGLFVLWAIAWAIGFTALWLTTGVGALDLLPTPVGWIVFAATMVGAIVWSAIVGIGAASDGIRGRSQLQGALYGISWAIVMFAAGLLLSGIQRQGLSAELAGLLYPGIYVFLVGVLYLSGGALWRAIPMYVLGVILIVVAVVATLFGAPTHYLVYAIAAPVAMLTVAALMYWGPLEASVPEAS